MENLLILRTKNFLILLSKNFLILPSKNFLIIPTKKFLILPTSNFLILVMSLREIFALMMREAREFFEIGFVQPRIFLSTHRNMAGQKFVQPWKSEKNTAFSKSWKLLRTQCLKRPVGSFVNRSVKISNRSFDRL